VIGAPPRTLRQLWPELLVVTLGVMLRVAMNASYDVRWSYDFDDHFAYIEHLSRVWSWMPLAESRAAYHPPLYYAIAALLVRAGAGVQALGWISIASGCARLLLILYGVLRWLPGDRVARVAALAVAAVLPASLHTDGMVTNEALNGFVCTAALLLAAELFATEEGRARLVRAAALGAVIGVALWIKQSALVILAAVVLVGAVAAVVAHNRDRARARSLAAALAVVTVACALVAGPWFAHTRAAHGRFVLTGFDGADAHRLAGTQATPYLLRRPLHYYVGFSPRIFAFPYAPVGLAPRAEFPTQLFATTFVDYYNFAFGPYPATLDAPLRANLKPLRPEVLALSRVAIAGGALVALATIAGWIGCALAARGRRDATLAVLLAIPALAVAGQLHFAVAYPIDAEGLVKGAYLQFAAAPLCATFGVAVAWLMRRRRARALAIAGAVAACAAVVALAVYDVGCRIL
jgi:hypothetical protein